MPSCSSPPSFANGYGTSGEPSRLLGAFRRYMFQTRHVRESDGIGVTGPHATEAEAPVETGQRPESRKIAAESAQPKERQLSVRRAVKSEHKQVGRHSCILDLTHVTNHSYAIIDLVPIVQ